jgi:hypothetical protein
MYVINNIGRTKNATNCLSNNDEVKIKLRLIIFTINCNKSRLISTSLIVRIIQILYYNRFTKANSFVFSYTSLNSLYS